MMLGLALAGVLAIICGRADGFAPPIKMSRRWSGSTSPLGAAVESSSTAAGGQTEDLPQALIFDCDGVLADTERDGHRPAFNSAFKIKNLGACERVRIVRVYVAYIHHLQRHRILQLQHHV